MTNSLRADLPPLPERMRGLSVDARGYPVPRFVEWIDGKPDFRVMSSDFLVDAVRFELCWLCGGKLGRIRVFTIGPMCAINRVSAEPPSHRECADFAVRACPFLSMPKAQRREANLPEHQKQPVGFMLTRNPAVTLLWTTKTGKMFPVPKTEGAGAGVLFDVGDPLETAWFKEKRSATRAEVLESIESGFPLLQEKAIEDGPEAERALQGMLERALALLPKEATS